MSIPYTTDLETPVLNALPVEVQLLRALSQQREEASALIEQVQDLVELRDRAIDEARWLQMQREKEGLELEATENELADVKIALARKTAELEALEEQLLQQAGRIQQLEATLQMLAEADEKSG